MTHTTRPSLHTVGSNISLDTLTPTGTTASNPYSSILNGAETTSPSAIAATPILAASSGYTSPAPPYPGPGIGDNYAHPRIRRKSISHIPISNPTESDTSADDPYTTAGTGGKGKKKRNRDGSFSFLPTHRRRRASNAASAYWPRWLGGTQVSRKYEAEVPNRRRNLLLLLGFILVWLSYREWRKRYDFKVVVEARVPKLSEIEPILPLKGCFDPKNISPDYNATLGKPRRQLLSPGISLMRGQTCYDFAATIQPLPEDQLEPLLYHTYWRADLLAFGERQMATVLAFLATQPLSHSKLIVWTNGADRVKRSEHIKTLLSRWGSYVEVRQVDMPALTKDTELEGILGGSGGTGLFDERAWVDGDAVRLLVLWQFGGVWMDMDQVLTRDLHPLAESEFVMQWDCYGESSPFMEYNPGMSRSSDSAREMLNLTGQPFFVLNGALMHFRQHSSYLCEAFHIMASSPLPKPNSFTWGSHLYSRLHRRLLAARITPFAVLPWCFADPRNCDYEVAFPDPFEADPPRWGGRAWDGTGEIGKSGKEMLEERLGHVWTVHLHNQWGKAFPPGGWVERMLDRYRRKVGVLSGGEDGEVEGGGAGGEIEGSPESVKEDGSRRNVEPEEVIEVEELVDVGVPEGEEGMSVKGYGS